MALLHPKILIKISQLVADKLHKPELTTEENLLLIDTLRTCSNTNIHQIIQCAAKRIKQKNVTTSKESIVSKYNQVNNYDVTKLFGISDKYALLRICNAPALYKYTYVFLNTSNSSTDADNIYNIKWQVLENNTLSSGTVNIAPIKDIVAMRIFPIKFDFINGNQYYRYYFLLIKELIMQSLVGYGNIRYHFALYSKYTTYGQSYWEVGNNKKDNYYYFNPPITTISSLTISMSSINGSTNIPMAFVTGYIEFTNPITVLLQAILIPLSLITRVRFYNLVIYHPEDLVNAAFIESLTRIDGWPTTSVYIPYDDSTRLQVELDGTVVPVADRPIPYFTQYVASVSVQFLTINTVIPLCFISMK